MWCRLKLCSRVEAHLIGGIEGSTPSRSVFSFVFLLIEAALYRQFCRLFNPFRLHPTYGRSVAVSSLGFFGKQNSGKPMDSNISRNLVSPLIFHCQSSIFRSGCLARTWAMAKVWRPLVPGWVGYFWFPKPSKPLRTCWVNYCSYL